VDKQQFEIEKAKIIAIHGKPEYDMREPVNEAAKLCSELHKSYLNDCRVAARLKAKELGQHQAPETLEDIEKAIPKELKHKYSSIPLPSFYLTEQDLKEFNGVERELLHLHFKDLELDTKALADRFGLTRQRVAALLKSNAVQLLTFRLLKQNAGLETWKGLFRAMKANDSKILLRMAEYLSILPKEETNLNINTKPITDPTAMKLLQELGDKLADENVNKSKEV